LCVSPMRATWPRQSNPPWVHHPEGYSVISHKCLHTYFASIHVNPISLDTKSHYCYRRVVKSASDWGRLKLNFSIPK
jgi:hypothetical protein